MKKGIRKPKINTMTTEEIEERKKDLKAKLKELRREVNYKAEPRKKKKKKSIDEIRKEAELRKQRLIAELRRKLQGDTWKAQVDSGKYGSLTKSKGGYKHKRASGVDIRKFTGTRKTRMNELKHSDDELLHYGVVGMRKGVRRWLERRKALSAEKKKHNASTKESRKEIKRKYRADKKAFKNQLRAIRKEHRNGNIKEVVDENYRQLKGVSKWFNDRKTAKYLSENRGSELGRLTLSDKMFKKSLKKYKKNTLKNLKLTRKTSLKALKFKRVQHGDYEFVLLHHGVLGQRWGIRRRFKNLVGRLKGSKSGKKFDKNIRVSGDDIKKAKDIRKRKLRDLSDDDLRSAISRLKLEKEYNHLRNETGKTASGKIKKFMQLPVGYTKDGKKKELGPVLAEKLLNVALNNKTFNSEVDSITSKGIDAIRDQAHKFKLSKKKKKG